MRRRRSARPRSMNSSGTASPRERTSWSMNTCYPGNVIEKIPVSFVCHSLAGLRFKDKDGSSPSSALATHAPTTFDAPGATGYYCKATRRWTRCCSRLATGTVRTWANTHPRPSSCNANRPQWRLGSATGSPTPSFPRSICGTTLERRVPAPSICCLRAMLKSPSCRRGRSGPRQESRMSLVLLSCFWFAAVR